MADQYVQVQPNSTGLKIDTTELTVNSNTVERQRIIIADPVNPAGFASVFPAGFIRTSDEPRQIFLDTFDSSLDTTNTWTAPTTGNSAVAASVTTGVLSMGTGTTASGWSKLTSAASFKPTIPAWIGFSDAIAIPDGAAPTANAYRFWGCGNPQAVPTTANPLSDAVGFELTTAGALVAVVYAGGIRTAVATLTSIGNANYHRYIVYVRTDVCYWFVDSLTNLVATSSFQSPQVQTLPKCYLAVGGSTPPASNSQITSTGAAVWDTGKNATQLADGTYPWRKATVDSSGNISVKTNAAMTGTVPGTAPAATELVGGIYNATLPTPTTGQVLPLQVSASGGLHVVGTSLPTTTSTISTVSNSSSISVVDQNVATVTLRTFTGTSPSVTWSLQASDDNTNWVVLQGINNTTGAVGTSWTQASALTAGTAGPSIDYTLGGYSNIRVQVTAISGAAASAVFGIATQAMPYEASPGATVNGVYNSALPTVTSGNNAVIQLDAKGQVLTDLNYVAGSAVATAATGIQKVGLTDGSGNAITSTSSAIDVNVKTSALSDPAEVAQGTTAPTKVVVMGGKSNDGTPQYKEVPLGTGCRSVISEVNYVAATALGTPQTFGTAPSGVVIGTSSDIYVSGTRARSNQTTTAAGVQDVNIVGIIGTTSSATKGLPVQITDNTTAVTAAVSALGTAPTGTGVMAVNAVHLPSLAAGAALTTGNAASLTVLNIKASAGNLYGLTVVNKTASVIYIQTYNSTTTPTLGTSVVSWIPVAASATLVIPPGAFALANFTTGIGIGASTTPTSTGTPTTAPDVVVWYK